MKTLRLLFNDEMARAIVFGRKTVTRRPIEQMPRDGSLVDFDASNRLARFVWDGALCLGVVKYRPPCAPGDLMIGRECWQMNVFGCEGMHSLCYRADHNDKRGDGPAHPMKWRPSIHMPDWAARIRRTVVAVSVERLHSITEEDAVREGLSASALFDSSAFFAAAWDSIYAARGLGWAVNPYVWRIEFGAENVSP